MAKYPADYDYDLSRIIAGISRFVMEGGDWREYWRDWWDIWQNYKGVVLDEGAESRVIAADGTVVHGFPTNKATPFQDVLVYTVIDALLSN